jgi:hypothetical protein
MTDTGQTATQRFDLRNAGLKTYLDAIEASTSLGEENGAGFFEYFTRDTETAERIADTLSCPHGRMAIDLAATLVAESLRLSFKAMGEHAVQGDAITLESMLGQFVGVMQHVGSLTAIFERTAELVPDAHLIGGATLRHLVENTQGLVQALALKHAAPSDPALAVKLAQDLAFKQDRAQDRLEKAVDAALDAANAEAEAFTTGAKSKLN